VIITTYDRDIVQSIPLVYELAGGQLQTVKAEDPRYRQHDAAPAPASTRA
jgi:hypothetical protein